MSTEESSNQDVNHIAHATTLHEESNTSTQFLINAFRQYDKDKSGMLI